MRVRFGYKLYPVGRSACEPPYSAYLVRGNTHFKYHTDCLTRVHGEGAFWRGGGQTNASLSVNIAFPRVTFPVWNGT